MSRSSHTQRAQHLNAAFDLLAQGSSLSEAAERMALRFGLSRRQAYRYLQEAQEIQHPVSVPSPVIPVTIKISVDVAEQLRAYARTNGLTIGEIVARSVTLFLDPPGESRG